MSGRPLPTPWESRGALTEGLESRLLLDAAPGFATAWEDQYYAANGAIVLPINGYDADGDELTITAETNYASVLATVPTGNTFASLNFYQASDNSYVGSIQVELFGTRAPEAVTRFVTLATNEVLPDGSLDPNGTPYYTNVPVHRVIDGFMFQTGDATNGDGTGTSALDDIPDEFHSSLRFAGRGVLAMANAGADTGNNQFFLTDDRTAWLNDAHTIFGQVIDGWAIYETIIAGENYDYYLANVTGGLTGQDGSVTVQAPADFTGNVTVTATLDDGNGNQTQHTTTVYFVNDATVALANLPNNPNAGDPSNNYYPATDTVYADGILYVADGVAGLEVFDVSDPVNPQILDIYDTPGNAWAVTVVGDVAYVADWTGGLIALDVQDPADVQYLDTGRAPGAGTEDHYAFDVAISGNYAFVAEYLYGVGVYNIADPANILYVGSITQVSVSPAVELLRVVDVEIQGDYLYISDNGSGNNDAKLVVLDISDPESPTAVTYSTSPALPWGMDIEGDTLYMVDQVHGLRLIDIANPASPTPLTVLALNNTPWMVTVHDGIAVVGRQSGNAFVVVDVTDPDHLAVLYYFDLNGRTTHACRGEGFWALPSMAGGITLVDDAFFAPVMLTTGQVEEQVDQGDGLYIQWIGGKPTMAVDVWVLGPAGHQLISFNGYAQDGFALWNTSGYAIGVYSAILSAWNGLDPATGAIYSKNVIRVAAVAAEPPAGVAEYSLDVETAQNLAEPLVVFATPTSQTGAALGEETAVRWDLPSADHPTGDLILWLVEPDGQVRPITPEPIPAETGIYSWLPIETEPGRYAILADLTETEDLDGISEWFDVW